MRLHNLEKEHYLYVQHVGAIETVQGMSTLSENRHHNDDEQGLADVEGEHVKRRNIGNE
jgi:hypothetical protein